MNVSVGSKPQISGKLSLFLDFYLNGKRVKEYLRLFIWDGPAARTQEARRHNKETRELAEKIRSKRQLELEHGEHGFIPKFKREANFILYFEGLVPKKHKMWHSVMLHLKDFSGGAVSFAQIDERWIESFRDYLLGNEISPNSVNAYLNKIKAALNLAIRDKIILYNPAQHVKPLKVGAIHRTFLSFEELQLLANTPCRNAEVKRAFLFACYTGLRLSDVKQLTWKNIKGQSLEIIMKKPGLELRTALNQSALTLIGAPKSPQSLVFSLPKSDWATWDNLQKWGGRAGLDKPLSFHVSRRTFATLSLSSGSELYTVSKLLGHRDTRNTQIYLELIDRAKQEAVNRLPQIEL